MLPKGIIEIITHLNLLTLSNLPLEISTKAHSIEIKFNNRNSCHAIRRINLELKRVIIVS
jgi:hypothetical protein